MVFEGKKHFQTKKWSKRQFFDRIFCIDPKIGYTAKYTYFWPKWPYCRGLRDHMHATRIITAIINTSNDSPRPILYSNIYFCIPWRRPVWHMGPQSCPKWVKNRFWGKSDYFYPKNHLFGQKTSERPKCAKKSCLSGSEHFLVPCPPQDITWTFWISKE